MKYEYHTIIIGAGSGGLVVASGSASLGAKVALIENNNMGGDCLNTGCVPSKSFLKCGHLARDIKESKTYGIESEILSVNLEKVMKRVHSIIKEIKPHDSKERYEALGVDVYSGTGTIVDNNSVQVNDRILTGKNIVISTGSEPRIPNIKGLDTLSYLTNKNVFNLKKLPQHLVILGGGPIGLELGQGFKYLGSDVTIIDKSQKLFTKDDKEVSDLMEKIFIEDKINLYLGSDILEVKKSNNKIIVIIEQNNERKEIKGDKLLVALGRDPSVKGIGINKVGIKTDKRGFILTDSKLKTNIKNIYACGDVTGPFQFTHMASYQAGIIIRNTIFKLRTTVNYSNVSWTTYTKPEIAHVGYTEAWADSLGIFFESIKVPLNEVDRAKAENDRIGFLKLISNKKGRLIGATLVGEKAGEMIPIASLAIKQKLKATVFMDLIFSYPTESEIFKLAALKKTKSSFKSWQKKLIRILFLR